MTAAIYQEFDGTPTGWKLFVSFLKANKNRALRLIVTEDDAKRNDPQNRLLHVTLQRIATNAWWDGKQYPMEFWKEYYRRRFLLKDEYQTPTGEIIQVYWSTADKKFSVGMCSELINKIMADAAQEFGVEFPI